MYGPHDQGQPFNPYAAPAPGGPAPGGMPGQYGQAFWRQGDELVVRKGAVLPDRCIATGVPTGGNAVTKELTWVPPWIGILFVLISPIIGLIVMLIVRKKGSLTYFVSAPVQAKRKTGVLVGVGLIVGSILMFVGGAAMEAVAVILLALVVFLAGIIVAAAVGMPFRLTKIDNDNIYIKVKPEFWNGLA